ncbi:MAG: hypothetical protein IJH28_01455 [Mogibacterium sp.]|nr:hypothetical protein [Mogibacterium sp.]
MDKFKNNEDFDYTIVMDPRYPGLDPVNHEPLKGTEPEKSEEPEKVVIDPWERLYAEYEEMCFKDPTILDKDDAYPHSYQWRVGDRYDPAKIEVLKAALREGKRITDTEAYQEFVEDIKGRKLEPLNWE